MKKYLILIASIFILLSCTSSKGIITEFWDLMPQEIYSFKSFLIAFVCIFSIQLFLSLISRLFIPLDNIIAIVLFILVLIFKEYGFLMTLLLFIFDRLLLLGITSLYYAVLRKRE